jgi:transposase
LLLPPHSIPADWRPSGGLYRRRHPARPDALGCDPARRQGYDSDAVRRKIESKGAAPNIPPKVNRRWKNCFSPYLYRDRNAIERMFGRLKDFRRIATRYDRLAYNFLAAICLAAIVCYWL